jgi:cyclophilin family peptidyl-prolyl cis-trans isomerase/HEAT repeat protein
LALKCWRVFSVAVLVLAPLSCAGPPPPPPAGGPQGAPVPAKVPVRFASPNEADASLLSLEDRRAFDEATLSSAARAPEPSIRAHAALAVGRIGDERGRDILRLLVTDKSADVRAAAAFGYEVMGDASTTPDLLPLLSDRDVGVVCAAAAAIGFLGRPDGQDALVAAIPGAAAPEPRATMLEALWKFPTPETEAAALRYAGAADSKVRRAALFAISRKPQERSFAVLTAALRDPDADCAAMAARALGLLARKDALEPLAAALGSGKPPLVINSLYALEAILGKSPGVLAQDHIHRVLALAGDANGNLAVPALLLLRQFAAKDREVNNRLWSIAISGPGRRRQVALQSVVAVLKGRAEVALQKAMDSPEPALRAAAAESLIFLSGADARPYRERLFADRDPVVRLAVLTSLNTPVAVRENRPIVNSALVDPDSGVRAAGVEALALLDDPSVLPILAEAVTRSRGDASPDVAIAVITACEKLRVDPAARSIVETLYRQSKTLVSRLARRSLVEMFRADPAAFHLRQYETGKTVADYAALLAEASRPWQARVETVRGEFTIRMAGDAAPLTVANFLKLTRAKFFDGVAIHRVVPNYVLQDGDPTGTGDGGPGYEIRDEFNPLRYERGTVGMATSGPDTGGSQWFVTQSPEPQLDALYTAFGQVVAGQDVVERIEQGDRIVRVTVSQAP